MIRRAAAIVGLAVYLLIVFTANAGATEIPIYYFMLEDDPFYKEQRTYAGLRLKQPRRALDGVKVALRESRVLGRALQVKFKLQKIVISATDSSREMEQQMAINQPEFIIADLPKEHLKSLSDIAGPNDTVIFNPRLYDNDLRQHACAKNIFHTLPSYAMLYDALAQYLKKKNWRKVLLLEGQLDEDKKIADAFVRSAHKMGMKIVDRRLFLLSNNPHDRSENNIHILTSGSRYDAVFVADSFGEFARYLPYQTNSPRVIVGSEGLIPSAWHWTWERYGAPQLNQRYQKIASRQGMSAIEWAGWAAVKAIVTSVVRSESVNFSEIVDYLSSDRLTLDNYKGAPGNFRAWNHQLRQPILLHTYNAVIASAPIKGFMHHINDLDSLGVDQRESHCIF